MGDQPLSSPWKIDHIEHGKMNARMTLVFYKGHIKRYVELRSKALVKRFMKSTLLLPDLAIAQPCRLEDIRIQCTLELNNLLSSASQRRQAPAIEHDQPKAHVKKKSRRRNGKAKGGNKRKDPIEYSGVLTFAGTAKRHYGDNDIEQFAIDLTDPDSDEQVTRLWGVDLQRAMQAAGVQVGEHVVCRDMGATKIRSAHGNGSVYRKEYSIEKRSST